VFCQKCGSDLPAVAKFCDKCGSRVETTPTTPPTSGSYCVNCGKPYQPSFKFCNYCGHALPLPQTQSIPTPLPVASAPPPPVAAPPPPSAVPPRVPAAPSTADRAEIRFLESYSGMSDDELLRLSTEISQLKGDARSALVFELMKRNLVDKHPTIDAQMQTERAVPAPAPPTLAGARKRNAPFAVFTLWYIASIGLCCSAIFVIAYAIARGTFGSAAAADCIGSLLVMCITAFQMTRTWKRITSIEFPIDDAGLRRRRKRVIVKSVVLALLFFSMSAGTGYAIGQSGAETAQVLADLAEMNTLGDRITKARTPEGNPGIDWYVQMYPQIESDVTRLDTVLQRLTAEYSLYAAKFPEANPQTPQVISNFNTGVRRMALLKQEIAVAKKMKILNEQQQAVTWENEMLPLLKEEDALTPSK